MSAGADAACFSGAESLFCTVFGVRIHNSTIFAALFTNRSFQIHSLDMIVPYPKAMETNVFLSFLFLFSL